MKPGGFGTISEGKWKDRKMIIPKIIWVETSPNNYKKGCIIHQVFVPDNGCPECKKEAEQ